MIRLLGEKITSFFVSKEIIKADEYDIYVYGFEYIIATTIGIASIICMAIIFGLIKNTIVFLIAFTLVRITSGGYHAGTYYKCLIIFLIVYIINILVLNQIDNLSAYWVPIFLTLLSVPIVFIFGPVDHQNKPFTRKEYLHYQSRGRVVILLLALIVLSAFTVLSVYKDFFSAMSLGIISASLSVMVGKIKEMGCYGKGKVNKINFK